jgi:hypothetical protein
MFEYIEFYTKNLSNFTVLLLLGLIIAILDITIRKIVKGVYLNVRENMRLKHGGGGGKEGLTTKKKSGGASGGSASCAFVADAVVAAPVGSPDPDPDPDSIVAAPVDNLSSGTGGVA